MWPPCLALDEAGLTIAAHDTDEGDNEDNDDDETTTTAFAIAVVAAASMPMAVGLVVGLRLGEHEGFRCNSGPE